MQSTYIGATRVVRITGGEQRRSGKVQEISMDIPLEVRCLKCLK